MKYKLTTAERADRIEQRAKARADKAGRVEAFRDWFEARRAAARKRNTEAAKAPRGRRGVDRVPARYRVHVPAPEYVVQHTAANHEQRRAWARSQGRTMPKSGNTPHVNRLGRDVKALRSGRLRKELRP